LTADIAHIADDHTYSIYCTLFDPF